MAARKKTATKRIVTPKKKPAVKKPAARRKVTPKAVVEETVQPEPVVEEVATPEQEPEVQPQVENVALPEPEVVKTEAQSSGSEPSNEDRSTKIYVISIIISIIILAIASGVFVYRSRQTIEEVQPEPTPTPEEVVMKEEEKVKVIERKDITLEVLNGSGVAGLAGDTKGIFEDLGYTVDSVGNTDSTEGNQLYISDKYTQEELANLITDAKEKLDIPEVAAKLSDLDVTARIVLGK